MVRFRNKNKLQIIALAVIALFSIRQDAAALIADDVLGKMSKDERFGYVSGLVDMLSYQSLLSGDQAHAQCVADAYYKEPKAAWSALLDLMERHGDKATEGIVVVFMRTKCPK